MKRKWLSLNDRIELALRHLTTGLDRRPVAKGTALEGIPFCHFHMGRHLVALHSGPDLYECPGRYLAPLALLLDANPSYRADGVSGQDAAETLAHYIDRRVNRHGKMEVTEKELSAIDSPEHLFVEPAVWKKGQGRSIARNWWKSFLGVIYDGHVSIALEGLVRWYLRTGDPDVRQTIQRMIKGRVSDPKSPQIRAGKGMVLPGLLTSLSLYYEATGDEAARRYLEEICDHVIKEMYPAMFPDGKHSHGHGVGHLHSRLGGLGGLIRYANVTGRNDLGDMAAELLDVNTAYGTEFGWLPERHVTSNQSISSSGATYQPWAVVGDSKIDCAHYTRPRHGWDTCEICVTADAVDVAILLAKSGREKYWDVAERWLNHVFEAQIVDDSFLVECDKRKMKDRLGTKFDGMKDYMIGAWQSATSPTWAVTRKQLPKERSDGREGVREGKYYGVGVACCHGWGARTLGLVWHNILSEKGSSVEVNLPFDKKSGKVEVKSARPSAGRISIKALKPVNLFVRIPDWVEHSRVEIFVNRKKQRDVRFKNPFSDYVKVGRLRKGQRAEVRYPLRRQMQRYHIDYHPSIYEADWLGNYVMGMKEIPMAKGQGEESFEGFGKLYAH